MLWKRRQGRSRKMWLENSKVYYIQMKLEELYLLISMCITFSAYLHHVSTQDTVTHFGAIRLYPLQHLSCIRPLLFVL